MLLSALSASSLCQSLPLHRVTGHTPLDPSRYGRSSKVAWSSSLQTFLFASQLRNVCSHSASSVMPKEYTVAVHMAKAGRRESPSIPSVGARVGAGRTTSTSCSQLRVQRRQFPQRTQNRPETLSLVPEENGKLSEIKILLTMMVSE